MKRAAQILLPASIAVACATVALPAGLGFDGISPQRICYADFGAIGAGDDSAVALASPATPKSATPKSATPKPAGPRADRCETRPDPGTSRS